MKYLIILACSFFLIKGEIFGQDKIMTYNIRYATVNDGINQWENRKERVVRLIRDHQPGIFGLQEALLGQTKYIETQLGKYEYVGVGRDDGKNKGEMAPIFFDPTRFSLLEWGHFWLSESPDIPSNGWDANLNRIVTWGKFKIVDSGQIILVINTHFDHQGEKARRNSSLLILEKIETQWSNLPLILMGDFNASPSSEPFRILNESNWVNDSFDSVLNPDTKGTFSGGFGIDNRIEDRIDHIFVSSGITVISHTFDLRNINGFFPSDHLPVIVEFQLN